MASLRLFFCFVFLFKQKTAYEMRISDWSSDVCSSDLMVTHNANLVINTDADQIIIAEAGPHPHNSLPPITYVSGGLENAEIRKMVCDILEGGAGAFQERARRLRVRLDR